MATLSNSFVQDLGELTDEEELVATRNDPGNDPSSEHHDGESTREEDIIDAEEIEEAIRMKSLAPNVSAIVGSAVAAKLLEDGNLLRLAKSPVRNVMKFIVKTEIYQNVPPRLRRRCLVLLATKCILAARVDFSGKDPTGSHGMMLCDEFRKTLRVWQEPRRRQ